MYRKHVNYLILLSNTNLKFLFIVASLKRFPKRLCEANLPLNPGLHMWACCLLTSLAQIFISEMEFAFAEVSGSHAMEFCLTLVIRIIDMEEDMSTKKPML